IRWFGRAAATKRSRRGAGSARRFTPRLEVLEGRALPAVFFGGVVGNVTAQAALVDANVGGDHHVTVLGSRLGTNGGGDGGSTEVTPFGSRLGLTGSGDGSGRHVASSGDVTLLGGDP